MEDEVGGEDIRKATVTKPQSEHEEGEEGGEVK